MKKIIILIFIFMSVYAGDYYKGMRYINKDQCVRWASIGTNDGITDRKDRAGHNGSKRKWRYADRLLAKDISSNIVGEAISCYEQGYDIGYYGK